MTQKVNKKYKEQNKLQGLKSELEVELRKAILIELNDAPTDEASRRKIIVERLKSFYLNSRELLKIILDYL